MNKEEIINKCAKKEYEAKGDNTARAKCADDFVFDANKSVNWNRQKVKELNKEFNEAIQNKRKEQAKLNEQFSCDIQEYIADYYSLNKESAKIIEQYVLSNCCNYICVSFIHELDRICKLITQVNNINKGGGGK